MTSTTVSRCSFTHPDYNVRPVVRCPERPVAKIVEILPTDTGVKDGPERNGCQYHASNLVGSAMWRKVADI